MLIDNNFKTWVQEISKEYKRCQIKAAIKVNGELIKFYFKLGGEIANTAYKKQYGNHFYERLSHELIFNLPNVKGLSPVNVRYAERFYTLYKKIFPQLVEEFEMVPWGHHRLIIDKCKNIDEALFFVNKIIENNWSRSLLENFLNTDLYKRSQNTITNIYKLIPEIDSDLSSEIIKDTYNFDFLSITQKYNEKELKDAIVNNIERFLLELGNGFAYVGKEVKLLAGNTELFCDLLFYNIKIHSYVVIEIKTVTYKPEHLGQLLGYVGTIDNTLKGEKDNPTIGIIICKNKDNTLAHYSLGTTNVPLGITEYELSKLIPEKFVSSLPSIEEIEKVNRKK